MLAEGQKAYRGSRGVLSTCSFTSNILIYGICCLRFIARRRRLFQKSKRQSWDWCFWLTSRPCITGLHLHIASFLSGIVHYARRKFQHLSGISRDVASIRTKPVLYWQRCPNYYYVDSLRNSLAAYSKSDVVPTKIKHH